MMNAQNVRVHNPLIRGRRLKIREARWSSSRIPTLGALLPTCRAPGRSVALLAGRGTRRRPTIAATVAQSGASWADPWTQIPEAQETAGRPSLGGTENPEDADTAGGNWRPGHPAASGKPCASTAEAQLPALIGCTDAAAPLKLPGPQELQLVLQGGSAASTPRFPLKRVPADMLRTATLICFYSC